MTFFSKMKEEFSISTIITFIAGVALLIYPTSSQNVLCMLVGGAIVFKGALNLVNIVKDRSSMVPFAIGWNVLLVGIGLFVATNPSIIMSIIPYAFGMFLLISSITSIQNAFAMKSMGYDKWAQSLISAVVRIILAVFLIVNSFSTAVTLTRFIGACLVFDGIATAITSFGMIKAEGASEKEVNELRELNLTKVKPDETVEKVEAEVVDVVQDTIDDN